MVFLYKKKSKIRSMINVLMVLVVAVCAMATIVIAQETPAAQSQTATVENDTTNAAVADSTEPTTDSSSQSSQVRVSNEYIAAVTSVNSASAAQTPAAAPAAEANAPAASMQALSPNQSEAAAVEANEVFVDGAIQSITFKKEMSLRDALRFLQARFHKNIVMSSMKVDGTIAVTQLYDVTFEEALNAILGSGFKWEQDGNFIKIYSADEYKKIKSDEGRMQYKVFTLYYVTAEEVKKLLDPIKSDKGKVESSTAAEKELSSGSAGGSSGGGSSGGSSGELSGGGGGDKMALHETIVVYDYPENITKAQDIIANIDVRPRQVLVEATILAATLTEGMELGVDFNFLGGVGFDKSTAPNGWTGGTPIATDGFSGSVSGNGLKVGVTAGDFRAFITALETVTDTTIMANPKILAINKQEGQLHIGDRLGYSSLTSQTSGGNTTSEIKFLEVGTMLTFRPYIGSDGYIRMDIYPKDSSGSIDRISGIPNEQTTQLKTNILVKDGETIVIGGLFRDEIDTTRNQIPLLGDIPFLGVLFRGTSDTSVRKEVIILLTPHIIEGPDQTDAKARMADIERKRYGAVRSLQWTQRSRLADDWYAAAVQAYSNGDKQIALKKLKMVLELRPTYQEAMQLQEKIVAEIGTTDASTTRRIMMERIEAENSPMWNRP